MQPRSGQAILAGALLVVLGALVGTLLWSVHPSSGQPPSPTRSDDAAEPLVQVVAQPESVPAGEVGTADVAPDCLAALAAPEDSSSLLREQRRLRIESYLDRQQDALRRELVADLAGYRPQRQAVFESDLSPGMFWRYAPPSPPDKRRLSHEEFRSLEQMRRRDGIDGLVELVDASVFQSRWGVTTYAGHLIEEHGEALLAALPAAAGAFPLGLHELAVAVRAGVGEAEFAALLAAAETDPQVAWHNGANLAKVAAIHNRPAILRALMARGVDPAAAPHWPTGRSVLDDVAARPRPEGADGTRALADVVRLLTAAGDRPYLPSTLATLAQWLPAASLPTLHPESEALLASLAGPAATVAAMDAEWTAKAATAAQLERQCEGETAAPDAQYAAGFPRDSSLAAKQRQQQALAAWAQRAMEELRAQAEGERGDEDPLGTVTPEAQRRRDAIVMAVADDRWDDAIAVADQLGGHVPMLLLHGALADAPLGALLALLERNDGRLPRNAAEYLARRADAAEIAAALEPYGLDLNYVDPRGRNAFGLLAATPLENDGAWRFAEYLASRSVPVKPSAWGLDPLDLVLTRLVEYPRASGARIRFARFLIDHGAPVEPSHLELAAQLSLRSEDAHRRLLRVVPELAS